MCYCDIDDTPSVYWESYPIARKRHTCCECGSNIDSGEKYWSFKGIYDGVFQTYKTCKICENIRNKAEAEGIKCIAFGCLYETVGSEFEYAEV